MKKIGKFILELLLGFLLSPVLILIGVGLLILIPFDYIKYKNSLYHKIEKEKYSLYAGQGINFKIYNEIAENNLPIRYVKHPQDKDLARGRFVFDRTLIIINGFSYDYDTESQKWFCGETVEEEIMNLDECIEIELHDFNENFKTVPCNDAVVLISEDDVYNLEMAAKEKRFLLYKEDRVGALKTFLDSRKRIN